MPSPLLHAAAGAGICLLDRRAMKQGKWQFVVPVVFAAILPDLDVLPGLLIGDPNRFHSAWSHSFAFGLIAGGLAALIARRLRLRTMLWVFVSWATHCLLDTTTPDGRPPYGVPLFWPFSSSTFQTPQPIFSGFKHGREGASTQQFFAEVFSMANLQTMLIEAVVGVLFVSAALFLGRAIERFRSERIGQ